MSRKPIPCPECGELYGGQGKVCKECFIKSQAEKRAKSETCPRCGGYKHRQSSLCQECYLEDVKRPENYTTKNCPVCHSEFTVHLSQIEAGYGKYCSLSCARSGSPTKKRTRVRVECHSCGKRFYKHKSEIKKNNGSLHFCSAECWYVHNQGENHYGYTGATPERQAFYSSREWKKVAKKVWKRDKATCQRCGIKKQFYRDGQFHIHHIVSFQVEDFRARLSNLILFCDKCHRWVHSNRNTTNKWIEQHDHTT